MTSEPARDPRVDQLVSWAQFAFELQRDWSRSATAGAIREIVFAKS